MKNLFWGNVFARNERLPRVLNRDYAEYSKERTKKIENMEEYEAIRLSTIALFNGLPEESSCGRERRSRNRPRIGLSYSRT
jgi:hypothetical protein